MHHTQQDGTDLVLRHATAGGQTTRLAADDLDAVLGFYDLARGVRTSHFNLIRNPRMAANPVSEIVARDSAIDPRQFIRLTVPAPGIAFLSVTSWDRVGGLGDLDCPLVHLLPDTLLVGAVVERAWYASPYPSIACRYVSGERR